MLIVLMLSSVVAMAQDELVSYTISGTVPVGVKTVFLNSLRNEPIDTASVENGQFQFTGSMPLHTFVTLADDGTDLPVNMLIDGQPVEVNMERGVLIRIQAE